MVKLYLGDLVPIHKYSPFSFCARVDWRVLTFDTAQSSDTPRWDADIGQVKDTENKRRYIGNILTLTRLAEKWKTGRLADF